ncbi:type VII secretion target [Mycobacterium sp.]|uniref:type VII secretion target n=1 Tax=Mycobacterium sp. TaxID=1785 RepID=UPI003BA850F9
MGWKTDTSTHVDAEAVCAVAGQMGAAAALIDGAVSDHLARLAFGGVGAGRAHIVHGDAVHAGLNRLMADLSQWSRAAVEIALALRAAANRYAEADLDAAARIA